tara:strand:+ start:2821 stop:3369 length:549 start_codon:yes stop_codon:yes gene_type:complete
MVLYSADIMDVAQPVKSVKEKKPLTEKQLAAIERRKKKTSEKELDTVVKELEKSLDSKPKRKRTKKSEEKVEQETVEKVEEKVEETVEKIEKPKRKRVKKEIIKSVKEVEKEIEPPVWFKKYIEGVQKEKQIYAEKKIPQKQMKIEAEEVAKKSWENGLTRDRVKDELDNHMSRMHKMIFGR